MTTELSSLVLKILLRQELKEDMMMEIVMNKLLKFEQFLSSVELSSQVLTFLLIIELSSLVLKFLWYLELIQTLLMGAKLCIVKLIYHL